MSFSEAKQPPTPRKAGDFSLRCSRALATGYGEARCQASAPQNSAAPLGKLGNALQGAAAASASPRLDESFASSGSSYSQKEQRQSQCSPTRSSAIRRSRPAGQAHLAPEPFDVLAWISSASDSLAERTQYASRRRAFAK